MTPSARRTVTISPPVGFPRFGWSTESVMAHYRASTPSAGDPVIVYSIFQGRHIYQLARVVNPCGHNKRISLDMCGFDGGDTFHRSGINVAVPKGQTWMLPPVPELMAHLEDNVDVMLDETANGPIAVPRTEPLYAIDSLRKAAPCNRS